MIHHSTLNSAPIDLPGTTPEKLTLLRHERPTQVRRGPVSLRPGRMSDGPSIAHIGGTTFAASFGYSLEPEDLQAYLEEAYNLASIQRDLSNPLMNFIVAHDDRDQVIGFTQITQGTMEPCMEGSEGPIELQRLYVDRKCHGTGLGKRLILAAEALARERGFKTIWLGVWEDNFTAKKVYERMGYVRVGEHDFKMGTCIQTDYIMSKSLVP